jgi:DNA-binding LacI/PurR family transcriptional regulator
MAQDPYEHGERGAHILLDELANGPKARATSLRAKAELLVRNSTTRPSR